LGFVPWYSKKVEGVIVRAEIFIASQVVLASVWLGTALMPSTSGADPMFIPAMLLELLVVVLAAAPGAVEPPLVAEHPAASRAAARTIARRLQVVIADISRAPVGLRVDG
jgi:hypothetical protein